jgi:1-aminocyclopropane-1-carboxylate deaminase/D-cysteine desulfhydrase-like pyridoxal-dependent ACC family enzyme
MRIGTYPTPVDRCPDALGPGRDLWVKRDDQTSTRYGGNKVRKLERVLDRVREAKRIVTVGGAGSHHVLATAIYARDLGIDVEAVLVPQPRTEHVVGMLRAIAARARIYPSTSFTDAATLVIDRVACGATYVPPGGSTVDGAMAYVDAANELLVQVREGLLPEPNVVAVTLGSGGTAAGLAAGFALARSRARVLAVTVAEPRSFVAWQARRLAAECVRAVDPSRVSALRLDITERYLGRGYGYPTPEGESAVRAGAAFGLGLDTTYTGKTLAAVRDLPPRDDPVLYWHTLSSAPMRPLLEGAPSEEELGPEERALLIRV